MNKWPRLFTNRRIQRNEVIRQPGTYPTKLTNANGKKVPYTLIVTQDRQQIFLPQQKADGLTGPLYFRSHSSYFKRYNSLVELPLGPRQFVKKYLQDFAVNLNQQLTPESLTVGIVTDTHDKADANYTYYGANGLQHVQELNLLDETGILDIKGHLGDAIDGSDRPAISQIHLGQIIATLNENKTPFFMVKGNHDENDKYDEKFFHDRPSFGPQTFGNIVYKKLFAQAQINVMDWQSGLGYFDKGDVRAIFLNTSDVPYLLKNDGTKKYDVKLTLAIRQQQIQQLIALLEHSFDKKIVIFGHANLIDADGQEALQYNGHAVHELLVAFNRKLKGKLQPRQTNADFAVNAKFDFTQNRSGQIWAYICGHRHLETDYRQKGIQYILLNCSALMGPDHQLTTRFNKNWQRKQGTITEFAGYVIDVSADARTINVFGYGAATPERRFTF